MTATRARKIATGGTPAALLAALVLFAAARPTGAGCRCSLRVQPLDVVFVFDSTGSMSKPIRAVKVQLSYIIRILRKRVPGLRIGMVTYRDYKDTYQVRGKDLTRDFARILTFMEGVEAGGGGDYPEAVHLGLEMAVRKFGWRASSRKVIVLIGDAPPHDDKLRTCRILAREAANVGTAVHTITTGLPRILLSFKEIADQTGGLSVVLGDETKLIRQLLTFSLGYSLGDDEKDVVTPPAGDRSRVRARAKDGAEKRTDALTGGEEASRPSLAFARLAFAGEHDVPHDYRQLLGALRTHEHLEIDPGPVTLEIGDRRLFNYPLLYVTGHTGLAFTAAEKKRLKTYLERGGFLFAEACCGRKKFDAGLRALLGALFPDRKLARLPAAHPVFRAARKIGSVRFSNPPATGKLTVGSPNLEGLSVGGHLAVIYSPLDLGCAWTTGPGIICGVDTKDAYDLTLNVLMYGMTR